MTLRCCGKLTGLWNGVLHAPFDTACGSANRNFNRSFDAAVEDDLESGAGVRQHAQGRALKCVFDASARASLFESATTTVAERLRRYESQCW